MKNFSLSLTALFLVCSLASCKKDSNSGPFFRFKVNGTEFEASGTLAYATYFSDAFTIYGVKSQTGTEVCYINLPKGINAGTYQLNDADHSGYYVDAANTAFSTFWGASSGSVTIEEITAEHVKGTFSFKAFDSDTETVEKNITEGEFDVDFR